MPLPLSKQDKIDILREMMLMRKFEEKAQEMYEARNIGGFLHLYIGQEAVASGFMWPIEPQDYVIGAYREHGQALARCAEPRRVMAELFGKRDGLCGGRGGSMHLFSKERRFLGGTAIVGGGLPIALGVGFAINYREEDAICLCFFGDGAINEGSFHESMNLASLWKLPILFICENNKYGMGTSVERASAVPNLFRRAQCYGMQVETVDGMDLLSVVEVGGALRELRPDRTQADLRRGNHVSLSRPLDRRPRSLPHPRGDRGVASSRPNHALRQRARERGHVYRKMTSKRSTASALRSSMMRSPSRKPPNRHRRRLFMTMYTHRKQCRN